MNILNNPNVDFEFSGLFTSSDEWIHPDRTEITYEIIYVTAGNVYMFDEKYGELELRPGSLAIFEPSVRHYGSKKSSGVSFYWVHFQIKNGELPFKQRIFEKIESPHLFKELLHYSLFPEMPKYLVNSVLIRILSELCFSADNAQNAGNVWAEKIYEWVRINASAKLSAESTAKHFSFSSDHASRIIKKNYGIGLKQMINRFTLSKAKELLVNTEKYIKEIAYELEFPDDKAFIGFFKYHEGVFPSEFRSRFYKVHMNKK